MYSGFHRDSTVLYFVGSRTSLFRYISFQLDILFHFINGISPCGVSYNQYFIQYKNLPQSSWLKQQQRLTYYRPLTATERSATLQEQCMCCKVSVSLCLILCANAHVLLVKSCLVMGDTVPVSSICYITVVRWSDHSSLYK